jgi:hypothetical protein
MDLPKGGRVHQHCQHRNCRATNGTSHSKLHKIKTIVNEAYGGGAAQYMKAGGFQLQDTSTTRTASGADAPLLFALQREWVQRGVIDPLSALLYPLPPQIGFRPRNSGYSYTRC